MNLSILDTVSLNHKDKASINYAKARCAIEEAAKAESAGLIALSRGNAALAKNKQKVLDRQVMDAKDVVIEHLKGTIKSCKKVGRKVEFFDNTTARY